MTNERPSAPKRYVVINPRGIPKGRFIFRDSRKRWFEGDVYDGKDAKEALRRGLIKEVKDG